MKPIAERPFFKRYGLLMSIAGVVAVLSANGALVYFALGTWTGFETKQHYVKGIHYNDNLAGATRQKALGWTVALTTTFAPPQNGTVRSDITATLNAADGSALPNLDVRIDAIRPTHEGFDRSTALSHRGGGVYAGALDLPLRGQWDLRIHAQSSAGDFQQTQRITTP